MFDGFWKLPGNERLEFALTITVMTLGPLAVTAMLFA